ncbi:Cytochrome P450 CYP2 subfamily [Handroanthus impetiginosus]|uniref:Cytochrome P450 CYP2 subfamily n=1 Tax=Handroanthus impetiginosus TaxID=429701 RepID=A0A2G9H8E5_9LAMI|nr:Cytochrome P450 CYP2 subfamily [Handroanthus impetiginosus]
MAWIWTTAISAIIFLYLLQQFLNLKKNKKLPPGPIGLPILGHFHFLGKNPHHDLHHLAQKHGPIIYLRFGSVPTIIVSSPAAAELFLKTHDAIFANRPHHEASSYLGYEQRNIVFGKYGQYWRNMRKLCTLELLSNLKISQFQTMRKTELSLLVGLLKKAAETGETVDLSVRITNLSADMTCLMVFGKKYEDSDLDEKGFKEVMKETMEEAAAFNIGDYFPYLRGLDLQGSARRLKRLSKIFDGFLERIIDEHVKNEKEKKDGQDFVDTMMGIMESGEAGFEFDRRHVKAVLLDMLLAGMDTSAAAVEWALSEVIRHPEVMEKLQKELEEVVGKDKMVEESHLPNLKYLDYVVRESFRLHPVGPLLIHESMEDCEVDGFRIPKKTRVLINVWAIGRDPVAWKDPEKFFPERFYENNVDVRGRDFQLIPFGSGRRGCPGLQLGLTMVQLMVAQLVHCFDWELPIGMMNSDLDMSENFGLVTARAKHLMAIPSYRLLH